jgi:hypothetical protein
MVEKWIPPTRSETAEIGKKTEGILGVNHNTVVVISPCTLELAQKHTCYT